MHTKTSRPLLRALVALVLGTVGAMGHAPAARAAAVGATVTNFTVTPATSSVYSTLTTTFDWCVPDGSAPGDTFQVILPDLLGTWPTSFPLTTADGTQVATGTINAGPPSFVNVTLGQAVSGQSNVCGTVSLQSQLRNAQASGGKTEELAFTTPTGVTTTTVTFDPIGPGVGNSAVPSKSAWFTDVDQCRTNGTDCLQYAVATQAGPTTADVRIVDNPPAGQSIDCSTLSLHWQDLQGTWVRGLNPERYTVDSCTSTGLAITVHGLLDGLKAVADFGVSVPTSPTGGVAYSNTATISTGGAAGTQVGATAVSNRAVGTATASAVTIDKRDVAGHAADTYQDATALPTGSTEMVITVGNRGLDALKNVTIEDTTVFGVGSIDDLSCDFSQAAAGAPTSGTVWAGPWPTGTSFTCRGTLTGVTPAGHGDLATVSAFDTANNQVRAKNAYYAHQHVVSVGDHVWWDANRNGVQDAGEKPAAGVVVNLLDAAGKVIGTDVTDANGFYSFTGLLAGQDFTMQFVPPKGATFTGTAVGGDRAVDSNPGSNGLARFTSPADGQDSATTPDDPTIDAGLVPPVVPVVTPKPVVTPRPVVTPKPVVTPRPALKTWTYLVQADRYGVVVPGNAAATRANGRLVASLDDDGALKYREDMGTRCQVRKSPTCLWYRTSNAVLTLKVVSPTQPTAAQVMAAYNAVAPGRTGKVTTTARMGTVTQDTTVLWLLGPGASASHPWGPRNTVHQTYLARS